MDLNIFGLLHRIVIIPSMYFFIVFWLSLLNESNKNKGQHGEAKRTLTSEPNSLGWTLGSSKLEVW